MGGGDVADIFVSYTSSDRDWAFWIAKELEALGHAPHVHEWEIERLALRHEVTEAGACCILRHTEQFAAADVVTEVGAAGRA